MQWLTQHGSADNISVLDIGGRNINGSARVAYPNADPFVVLDILDGDNVNIVADAAIWEPDRQYDLVVSSECFEHAQDWRAIVKTAFAALRPGGVFVGTMAGPGRPIHSGHDGGPGLYEGEYYENIDPGDLNKVLSSAGFEVVEIDSNAEPPLPCDVRCFARKPSGQQESSASDVTNLLESGSIEVLPSE
jgi:SAM-dependent methyltransferase